MFRLYALLEKSIKDGNVVEAVSNMKEIMQSDYPCVISVGMTRSNPVDIYVNVYDNEMQMPLKLRIETFMDDTFLDVKRKVLRCLWDFAKASQRFYICGELSSISPYQLKLFICKGSSTDIVYEFPMNKNKLNEYFKSDDDFKLNPICVFITEAVPNIEFESVPTMETQSKWTCKQCTFLNNNDNINCQICGANR